MNNIGLDIDKSSDLAKSLNQLLANYQVFYMNARGFHWNIKGEKFFELHVKFEELYTDALLKIDEIGERILTLGQVPMHTYADYLQNTAIAPEKNVANGKEAVKSILDSFKKLLTLEREILKLSAEADDEGTNSLMSDYIKAQEKTIWMYNAYMA